MNVPTPDDVFQGVRARLAADAAFAARLPGGAHYGRRSAGSGSPYLVGTVEETAPDYEQSDGAYLQSFVVELTVWCESSDAAAADTRTPRQWLDGLLGWRPTDPANGVSVPGAVRTQFVRPAGGSLRLSPELRKSQDVLAAGKRVEVRIQGQR